MNNGLDPRYEKFLGKRVSTPQGTGVVRQVFGPRLWVSLDEWRFNKKSKKSVRVGAYFNEDEVRLTDG